MPESQQYPSEIPTVCYQQYVWVLTENQAFHLNNKVNLAFNAFAANRSIVLLIH